MGKLPIGYRQKFRELTYGPIDWGAWSWSFQDGSCWVALYFDGAQTQENFVAWSAVTAEVDECPIVGCWVEEEYRGRGLAAFLISTLLHDLVQTGRLTEGETVYAKASWLRKYPELIEAAGLEFEEWT